MPHNPSNPSPPPAGFPFSPQEALDFMQKMWNPLGVPIPGFAMPGMPGAAGPGGMPFPNPAAMFATIDPAELDRKIAELKIVENWLTMSVNLIQMSVKTMEMQKASLEAMRAVHASAAAPADPAPRRRK